MNIDELIENFELLDDWEDKYRYLIDLGEKLPTLDEKYKIDEWKVRGCQSQVWLIPEFKQVNGKEIISFKGDSDAAIVRGLISVVLSIFNDSSKDEIKAIEVAEIFAKLGLEDHLSPSRRNEIGRAHV